MNMDIVVSRACERIPGMIRGALVVLPEGFTIGATQGARFLDLEPLIRSAARCLAPPEPTGFVEYMFVIKEQLVVFEASRRDPRVALLVVTEAASNVGFVLGSTRLVVAELEAAIDLAKWGM